MRNRSGRALLAGLALTAMSGPVAAADSGFYFVFNAGRSDFDLSTAEASGSAGLLVGNAVVVRPTTPILLPGPIVTPPPVAFVAIPANAAVDRSDFTWSASVGYSVNRYLSVELGYSDLGEVEGIRTSVFPAPFSGQIRQTQELSVETYSLSLLGTLPLTERWTVFARAGYSHNESEARFRVAFPDATVSNGATGNADFDSDDVVVGAGVGFKLSESWSLRANYERILDAGSSAIGDIDVDTIGLSAIYRL